MLAWDYATTTIVLIQSIKKEFQGRSIAFLEARKILFLNQSITNLFYNLLFGPFSTCYLSLISCILEEHLSSAGLILEHFIF